jgi:lysophospholipase L1-like esterase
LWLCLTATLGSVLLAELGLRLFFPHFQLPFAQAGFSPRYHHSSADFSALLKQVQIDPAAFKGDVTVAVLGDSFVAGSGVDDSRRFTSIMQSHLDGLSHRRIKIINFGFDSFSTIVYERLYRDVIVPLDAEVVIICLDQTDAADDYLYAQELPSESERPASVSAGPDFENTVLKQYESYPCTFFLLRNSQLFLRAHLVKQRLTGTGFIPQDAGGSRIPEHLWISARDRTKLMLYLETCRAPEPRAGLFRRSAKYIESISRMKPAHQKLFFVTYPRAENLAGQRKTTLLEGALPDSHASTPYFEYWIERSNLAGLDENVKFVHTSGDFRAAIASNGRQYYFHRDHVHWNDDGHRLFAEILSKRILSEVKEGE